MTLATLGLKNHTQTSLGSKAQGHATKGLKLVNHHVLLKKKANPVFKAMDTFMRHHRK